MAEACGQWLLPIPRGTREPQVLAEKRKARLGDALIAQICIDGGVPLITRDRDFQAFAETAGLNLILE